MEESEKERNGFWVIVCTEYRVRREGVWEDVFVHSERESGVGYSEQPRAERGERHAQAMRKKGNKIRVCEIRWEGGGGG
ncbi:uncharacterized protein G2W53_016767 [Senna tora]|uniref:Uncharacterized protein n=1 Tax=Senna tora TaxID=362788 RepID=A0A834WLT7_9FABA|nr:uncharacterized protein G2W53_016767 [Senna tora]